MTVHVDVELASDPSSVPVTDDIVAWVNRAIVSVGRDSKLEVSVRVVDEAEMQALNSEFRKQNKPTNVLSFPAAEIGGLPIDAGIPLGDIVVCAAVVADEAMQQGKSLRNHWAHMMVHGTLHLLGYDHDNDADADEMEGLEIQILNECGIANPYGESLLET
ncbi:MAG: rRNA maturation RNase YbeY [Woeseiaceae bacterium]|nr:rRNA maturation RNase YbeY [Woeseiaceae bacterium]